MRMTRLHGYVALVALCVACAGKSGDGGDVPGGGAPETVNTEDSAPLPDGSAGPDTGSIPCTSLADCEAYGLECDLEAGVCTSLVCEAETVTCADASSKKLCADDGLSFEVEPCPAGEGCMDGECGPVICDPGTLTCEEGMMLQCHTSGTMQIPTPCSGDKQCIQGACRPILHNVILLFDTSASMNECVDDEDSWYTDCCPGGCPAEWPVCETYENPLSKLGYSKAVYKDFFTSSTGAGSARYALLTFPQTPAEWHSFCHGGYWYDQMIVSDDDDSHETAAGGWFEQNMSQVVKVPFRTSWDENNVSAMLSWIDFVEILGENPELRAGGATPLGKSMFYAGEYIRHHLVVEGRPCTVDADCGSPDYVCKDDACHDPIAHCRQNILLVFTDGRESVHEALNDFFNPVVQARRMKFGLGCAEDGDCLGDAGCIGGYCQRFPQYGAPCATDSDCPPGAWCIDEVCLKPGFEWPGDAGVCANSGFACTPSANDCAGFLEACDPIDGTYVDPGGVDTLRAPDGSPIEVTTHVIDVSVDPSESILIAAHGGGRHFSVDLAETEILLEVLYKMTDIKFGVECVAPEED